MWLILPSLKHKTHFIFGFRIEVLHISPEYKQYFLNSKQIFKDKYQCIVKIQCWFPKQFIIY